MTSHDSAIEAATEVMTTAGFYSPPADVWERAISAYLKEMGTEAKPIGYIRQSLVENLTNGADGAWNCQVSNVEFANFRIPLFLAPSEDIEKLKAERDELRMEIMGRGETITQVEAERDAKAALLEEARRVLEMAVGTELAAYIRKLVAGWNGEERPEEERFGRHPDALGASIPTNCGQVYALDEFYRAARSTLVKLEQADAAE